MRIVKHAAAFALATLAALPLAPPAAAADTAGAEKTIRAAGQVFARGYNAGDAAAVAALYAPDAEVMPPGAPALHGQAEVRAFLEKDVAEMQKAGVSLHIAQKDEVTVSGKTAWHCGTWSATDKAGKVVDAGSYLEAWRESGGKWLIARDIWNSDRPPAPAPTAAK
jgi:ketosteroid isomerase-like protein